MQADPYSAEFGDWRLNTTGWVTAVDGKPLDQPAAYCQVSTYEAEQGRISFQTPSAAALHLNAAWKAVRRAVVAKELIRWHESPPSFASVGLAHRGVRDVDPASTPALFDYFEDAMTVVTSSYASLEAFCNSTLVAKLSAPIVVGKGRRRRTLQPEEIEEQVGTEEKLGRILPKVLGVPSPAGKAIWQRFRALKDLRDSMTHFKRRDQARHADRATEPTALHDLLQADLPTFPAAAMALVEHFHPTDPPRWLRDPAWVDGGLAAPLTPGGKVTG